jgi:hypothetical protein
MFTPYSIATSFYSIVSHVFKKSVAPVILSRRVVFRTGIRLLLALCATGYVYGQNDRGNLFSQPMNEDVNMFAPGAVSTASTLPVETIIQHVQGAVTARSEVELTGCFEIDGRDYNSLNALVGPGIFGVSTCSTFTISGIAYIGGNGIAPVKKKDFYPVRDTVCHEHAVIKPYFDSPESFLGLEKGSLDRYKISASELITPFEGIVYVTEDVGPFHLRDSKGILIVHNESYTARLKIVFGNFTGLIICDVIESVPGRPQILGAVVTLSPHTKSKFGSGCAEIHYSLHVLNNLDQYYHILR